MHEAILRIKNSVCLQHTVFANDLYVEFATLLIGNSLKLGINLKTFVLLVWEGNFVTIVFYINRMSGSGLQIIKKYVRVSLGNGPSNYYCLPRFSSELKVTRSFQGQQY